MGNRLHIITPVRRGGPWKWGATLAASLNRKKAWNVTHIHALPQVLVSPLYQGCDIVHTAIPITYRLWKKPVILTIRGDYRRDHNLWSGMYPTSIKMADVVTVPSHFLKNSLGLRDAVVIPPAVDLQEVTFDKTSSPLALSPSGSGKEVEKRGPVHLLTVTNFHFPEKAKGILKIVEALAVLKSMNVTMTLSVLGEGPYRKDVESEALKRGVPVQFHGFADPKPFFIAADIFVYWSDHDNTPIALLEAMSYGLPVVTNAVGAVPELVDHGKTGLMVQNEEDYRECLHHLISDPASRRGFGQAARDAVIRKFHHDVITPQYEEIYRKWT